MSRLSQRKQREAMAIFGRLYGVYRHATGERVYEHPSESRCRRWAERRYKPGFTSVRPLSPQEAAAIGRNKQQGEPEGEVSDG